MESAFAKHRNKVLGHYGTASWLRKLVLAMWNGGAYQVGLSQVAQVDDDHATAAFEMLHGYRRNGERDKAFMALALECRQRAEEEEAAARRDADLEAWMQTTSRALRAIGLRRTLVDDHYGWFERQFDAGIDADAAALNAKAQDFNF